MEKKKITSDFKKKKPKTKKIMESQNNLKIIKLEPTNIPNKEKSTNLINDFHFIDCDDGETQDDTDVSTYAPNFVKNFDGKNILIIINNDSIYKY